MNLIEYRSSRKKQVSVVARRAAFAGLAMAALLIVISIINILHITPY